MPIERIVAGKQIKRLMSLPYFPAAPEAIEELVTALAEEARTKDDAEGAISAILSDVARASSPATNRAPSPGEIRAWVQARIEADLNIWKSPGPPPWCLVCSGTGRRWPEIAFDMTQEQWDAAQAAADGPCPACHGKPTEVAA